MLLTALVTTAWLLSYSASEPALSTGPKTPAWGEEVGKSCWHISGPDITNVIGHVGTSSAASSADEGG